MFENNEIERQEKEVASLILGTVDTPVWLIHTCPDQIAGGGMRGDPPRRQFYTKGRKKGETGKKIFRLMFGYEEED